MTFISALSPIFLYVAQINYSLNQAMVLPKIVTKAAANLVHVLASDLLLHQLNLG
jgi:hypothetical protein